MVNGGGFFMWVSVQMFGPSAGWMFAWTNVSRDPSIPNSRGKVVVLRYENGVWTSVAAPPVTVTTEVFGLSAVSANEAWTVGTDYGADLKVVIAHYVNGAWSLWPKTFAGNSYQSITMFSPTDGWAAYDSNDSLGTVLLHYDGSAWAPVAIPVQWTSQRVFLIPLFYAVNSDVTWFWATADTDIPNPIVPRPLIEQYNHGQWEQASWPFSTVMPQALAAGSGNELWGVGDIAHQEGCAPAMVTNVDQGVFLHFQLGHWSEQVLP
jgi:hypothetical protein